MRHIDGTVEEYRNISWPVNSNATLLVTISAILSCPLGIPANLLVLYLSFYSKTISGDYKYFLANLAFCDLSYCLAVLFQCVFHYYNLLNDISINVLSCSIPTSLAYCTALCACCAVPLASVNRYMAIVHGKYSWFTRRRIILLCLTAYLPVLQLITNFVFSKYVVYYGLCKYTYYIPYSIEIIFFYIICIAYPALMLSNISLYRFLSRHMGPEKKEQSCEASRLHIEHEKSILKAVTLQGALPVAFALPIGIVHICVFFVGWDDSTIVLLNLGDHFVLTTTDVSAFLFVLTPTVNALIALLVIDQYKAAFNQIREKFKDFLCCKKRPNEVGGIELSQVELGTSYSGPNINV